MEIIAVVVPPLTLVLLMFGARSLAARVRARAAERRKVRELREFHVRHEAARRSDDDR